jgi:hypothetical protein
MSTGPFVEFAAGDTILREGEPASALYIIDTGQVAIARDDAPDAPLAELGPGDFFGEMAILQEQAHSATVRATSAVRALRIDAAAFHGVLRENSEIAVQLMRRLVLRLQAVEQRQRGAAAIAPSAAMPAAAKPGRAAVAEPPPPPAPTTAVPPATAARASAPAPAGPRLRHADGEIELQAGKPELLVGRPDPATGAIPEVNLGPLDSARTLSRRHARLIASGEQWLLREEPGVGNGTWVNAERLRPDQTVALQPGDRLRFGAIEVEFVRG